MGPKADLKKKLNVMNNIAFTLFIFLINGPSLLGQSKLVEVETKTYTTTEGIDIQGQSGFLEVAENRNDPKSRILKVKYVWLKSLAKDPASPVVYIEGGGGLSTWQAEDPEELTYWLDILRVSDLIFVDRRGEEDESLIYIWQNDFPEEFFVTEEAANEHYQNMSQESLKLFEERGVDIRGYNIEEEARDVDELMFALDIDRYSIFGFSFGSHIGMTIMKLFPDRVDKAILSGSDAPNQAFNFPHYLEDHIDKISGMVKANDNVNKEVPDFSELVYRVMKKVEANPAVVEVKNPLNGEDMKLKIGAFGLGFLLRLDIDDYNDIPILPRLFYTIDNDDYSILQWFAQRRLVFALAVPGSGINQYLAAGAGEVRWSQIINEANESIFGNTVNFPYSASKDIWVENNLSFNPALPLVSDIPTLFVTGTLDCRTPVAQVEETITGFSKAVHIKVENAGHEQAHWHSEVFDEAIPAFLKGESIVKTDVYYDDVKFIKVKGDAKGHPSIE